MCLLVPQNVPLPISVLSLNSSAIQVTWSITTSDIGPLLNYIIRAYVTSQPKLPPVESWFDALTSSGTHFLLISKNYLLIVISETLFVVY